MAAFLFRGEMEIAVCFRPFYRYGDGLFFLCLKQDQSGERGDQVWIFHCKRLLEGIRSPPVFSQKCFLRLKLRLYDVFYFFIYC